jgi:hypothetical protein
MPSDWDRERVKKRVLPELMGKNCYRSPLKAVCEREFPREMQLIHDFKVKDYAYLACVLQYIESSFVIGMVCRRSMELDIPTITLHDCLFTTPRHIDRVERIIREEAGKLGLRLSLKRDQNVAVAA